MANKWYPVIDYMTCTECGLCAKNCPHDVYDKAKAPTPVVTNPVSCVKGCRFCANNCPVGAISYVGDGGDADSGCCCGGENENTKKTNTCCGGGCCCDDEPSDCGCGDDCGCGCEEEASEDCGCGGCEAAQEGNCCAGGKEALSRNMGSCC